MRETAIAECGQPFKKQVPNWHAQEKAKLYELTEDHELVLNAWAGTGKDERKKSWFDEAAQKITKLGFHPHPLTHTIV